MRSDRLLLQMPSVRLDDAKLVGLMRDMAAEGSKRARQKHKSIRGVLDFSVDRRALMSDYRFIGEALMNDKSVAGQNFFDNFYVVEKTLAQLNDMMSVTKLDLLPMYGSGRSAKPRVFAIAFMLVSHTDGVINVQMIDEVLGAYQELSPLLMREVRLFPEMLKCALLKLIRVTADEEAAYCRRDARMRDAARLILNINDETRRKAFVQRLELPSCPQAAERLISIFMENDEYDCVKLIHALLERADIEPEELMRQEQQRRVRRAMLLANALSSLRTMENMSGERFYVTHSRTSETLMRDKTYSQMDTRSRAYYDSCVEKLSKKLNAAEAVVAREAVTLATDKCGKQAEAGFYICAEGVNTLCASLRPDMRIAKSNMTVKMTSFILLELVILAPILYFLSLGGVISLLLALFPAWCLARSIAIRLILRTSTVKHIPRLAFSGRIDGDNTTLIVVPTLITSKESALEVIKTLEAHYLANRGTGCAFALLGDLKDAAYEIDSHDEKLIKETLEAFDELNKKYAGEDVKFIFLMRKRTMSRFDGIYQGRERKRGAIEELVRLIVDEYKEPFTHGADELPEGIKYIITLDADTMLPIGTLRELVGGAAHPLNAPEFDENGVVKSGYGVIAPKMRVTAASAAVSLFAKIAAGEFGMDAYASATSEFYQDYFGTGNFGGKGIINVEAYACALFNRINENAVLSHDLLEGCFLRTGFMGDVTLYDNVPSTFAAWWKRQHRWVRGDWQLLPYLFNKLPDAAQSRYKNPLSFLSKVKILDNIRSSMVASSLLYTIVVMPYIGSGTYITVTLIVLAEGLLFEFIGLAYAFFANGKRINKLGALFEKKERALYTLVRIATLPFNAIKTGDAMTRALYRMLISHKKMLEWQTAAQNGKKSATLNDCYRYMFVCTVFGVIMVAGAVFGSTTVLAILFSLAFFAAPALIYILDGEREKEKITDTERDMILSAAKRTWRYFDAFMNDKRAYLPPDNYQEKPLNITIDMTSPTNIGMGLMSVLCAHELGFIDERDALLRIEKAVTSIENLEKWHGNLYNWYRIDDNQVAAPRYVSTVDSGNLAVCLLTSAQAILGFGASNAKSIAKRLRDLAQEMDLAVLYDEDRALFSIGYDCENNTLSESWYDMMASEARLTSFIAIALGKVKSENWQRLSRLLIKSGGKRILASWSGTMFEYLMPVIFTGTIWDTLMQESAEGVVRAQMDDVDNIPWGISESGYYAFDSSMRYQYRAFGVKKLALSPSNTRERVISPYSTALSLMISPSDAISNMGALYSYSAMGEYGFYEAIDFTPSRIMEGKEYETVKSYMAHHQGMSLCSYTNVLKNDVIAKWFYSIPEVYAARILLEERKPSLAITIHGVKSETVRLRNSIKSNAIRPRVVNTDMEIAETQLLSNGRYTLFMTQNGGGYSKRGDIMLTRFHHEGGSRDGVQIYTKTADDVMRLGDEGTRSAFEPSKIEQTMERNGVLLSSTAIVSPRRDAQVNMITVTNRTSSTLEADITVFAEISLAQEREDASHPAFIKLTIDAKEKDGALFIWRRSADEKKRICAFSKLISTSKARYSTDMLPFRNNTIERFLSIPVPPGGDVSAPIEPCVISRTSILVKEAETVRAAFIFGAADDEASACAALVSTENELKNIADLAFGFAVSALRLADIEQGKAEMFERFAARLLLESEKKNQPCKANTEISVRTLYSMGISGDSPIILMRISRITELRKLKTLIAMSEYLAQKRVYFDLVFLGDYPNEYRNELKTKLEEIMVLCNHNHTNIRLIHAFSLNECQKLALYAAARIIIDETQTLDKQVRPIKSEKRDTPTVTNNKRSSFIEKGEPLVMSNGIGGFSSAGNEYVIRLKKGSATPLPWSNILANDVFGTLVTESGGGFTYYKNSRLGRLTEWTNDPIFDSCGEQVKIYDDESGEWFSPYRESAARSAEYTVRHGFGYTQYHTGAQELDTSLCVFADSKKPIKYSLLTLKNPMMKKRKVTVVYSAHFILGAQRKDEYVSLCIDEHDRAVNAYSAFSGMSAFISFGADLENCCIAKHESNLAIIKTNFELDAGCEKNILMLMGSPNAHCIEKINTATALAELALVKGIWRERIGAFQIKTPDESINIMTNGWLLYQTWSSRLLSKAGFYQCGGATGFRDQLQDVMALCAVSKRRAKKQILDAAARQFREGDVLHWWHEPNLGVRTYIRDDRLFLPLAVVKYAQITGDAAILDEKAPYLKSVDIPPMSRDLYTDFETDAENQESIYAHCVKAIESVLETGSHGLLLMYGGDWNDGMDNVGANGGESVWLTMLTVYLLEKFVPYVKLQNDEQRVRRYEEKVKSLRAALEKEAWDGEWYLRAYYGNGAKLGSRENDMCAIDCISQSWAVICGLEKARRAFDSAYNILYDKGGAYIKLLSPPFAEVDEKTGYISAYVRGVRENGGQYTHGAAWLALAACILGEKEKALELIRALLPCTHTERAQDMAKYKGEPYAVAGDVYSAGKNAGRVGWTWYTGASSWLYSIITEDFLGIKICGNTLFVEPQTPFDEFSFTYKFGETIYEIEVKRGEVKSDRIILLDDKKKHKCVFIF